MNTKWNIKLTGLVLVLFVGLLAPLSPTLFTEAATTTMQCVDGEETPNNLCDSTVADINTQINSATSGDTIQLGTPGAGVSWIFNDTIVVKDGITLDCNNVTHTIDAGEANLVNKTQPVIQLEGSASLSNCSIDYTIAIDCTDSNGNSKCDASHTTVNTAFNSIQNNNKVLLR